MDLNPFSYEFHEDPYPTYRWLGDACPLYHNPALDFCALSRFRDVLEASHDWRTYSSAEGITLERLDPSYLAMIPMMIFQDPPRHDRLRNLVSSVFTPRRVRIESSSVTSLRFANVSWQSCGLGIQAGVGDLA